LHDSKSVFLEPNFLCKFVEIFTVSPSAPFYVRIEVRESKQSVPALQETSMSVLNKMETLLGRAAGGRSLLLLYVSLVLGPRAYAQTQAQPAGVDSPQMSATPETSEVPPAVAKELEAVKARMAQMESQLKDLTAFVAPPTRAVRSSYSAPTEVTLTGTLSCGHCQGVQPVHKGYTQYSWALNSVSQGDDIVLVGPAQVYKLQGDKEKLLKFMSAMARVTGRLDGSTLEVEGIARAVKGE
jgi:hypothetical protein